MRVGYAIGPKPLFRKMVVCKQGRTSIPISGHRLSATVFMTQYDYEAHLKSLQEIYRRKSKKSAGRYGTAPEASYHLEQDRGRTVCLVYLAKKLT